MSRPTTRPETTEYAPYYEQYIRLVPDGPIIETLSRQLADTVNLLSTIPEPRANHRYAPEKWSIKEVIGHVVDSERIFGYRALRFARGDQTALAGFEQDGYVQHSHFDQRKLKDILEEFDHVRRANLYLFKGFSEE